MGATWDMGGVVGGVEKVGGQRWDWVLALEGPSGKIRMLKVGREGQLRGVIFLEERSS